MKWQHYLFMAFVVFVGYWLGERYPNALKSIPAIGNFT